MFSGFLFPFSHYHTLSLYTHIVLYTIERDIGIQASMQAITCINRMINSAQWNDRKSFVRRVILPLNYPSHYSKARFICQLSIHQFPCPIPSSSMLSFVFHAMFFSHVLIHSILLYIKEILNMNVENGMENGMQHGMEYTRKRNAQQDGKVEVCKEATSSIVHNMFHSMFP